MKLCYHWHCLLIWLTVLTGIRAAPVSILLHGPPNQTKLAKAVAGEANAALLSVGPSDILSKFVGESEASIRGLFREARMKARKMESKCAVIFFDEIDALGRDSGKMSQAGGDNSSRRLLAELLIQMTELSDGSMMVVVIIVAMMVIATPDVPQFPLALEFTNNNPMIF